MKNVLEIQKLPRAVPIEYHIIFFTILVGTENLQNDLGLLSFSVFPLFSFFYYPPHIHCKSQESTPAFIHYGTHSGSRWYSQVDVRCMRAFTCGILIWSSPHPVDREGAITSPLYRCGDGGSSVINLTYRYALESLQIMCCQGPQRTPLWLATYC